MKNKTRNTAMAVPLQRIVHDLLRDATDQKRRVRERLRIMRGDEIHTPSRGPIQKNGMRCIRWHYWQAATAKHREITERITAIKPCIPNEKAMASPPLTPTDTTHE